ncbi:ATP-binding protein [Croceitalea marina]|uniref:histidine kinase n=1 Tax=Croceitalea marina TaxID=1775166 RepID=A0ABW5MXZ2_9FLAO
MKDSTFSNFLEAIAMSYENYDEKLTMMQRATAISSEELYEANVKLREEGVRQQNILVSLEKAISSLTENFKKDEIFGKIDKTDFDAENSAKYISSLAKKVSEISLEKDKLLKDLEDQNQSLNNYAHAVSHDLKSPIRNINTLMSWILESEEQNFSDSSKENFALVSENLEKMDKLIDGILSHASLGQTSEKRTTFNLKDLLEEISQIVYVPENVEIILEENLPILHLEKEVLQQLFMNLMTNAITATEHREHGRICISAEEEKEYWKFKITDNGKGIDSKYQSAIFKMFKKLENDSKTTGIGLAIVKKIVELYKGKIWLESELDRGTTFYFTIKK